MKELSLLIVGFFIMERFKKGQVVGNCIFIKEIGKDKYNKRVGLFQCECGNEFQSAITKIKTFKVRWCGCMKPNYRHGMSHSKIYSIWNSMIDRCYNSNSQMFSYYGGRGINVCHEWKGDFVSFYNYASKLHGYGVKGMTLDRVNTDGNYEPGNIRWANMRIQQINTRKQKNTSSKYKGVSWQKDRKKWKVEIKVKDKKYYLGRFKIENEAVSARNAFIVKNNLIEYPIQELIYNQS